MRETTTAQGLALLEGLGRLVRPDVLQRGLAIAFAADGGERISFEPVERWPDPTTGGQRTIVSGSVEGTENYAVTIDAREHGRVACACACPYFEDRQVPCKHIVAFLVRSVTDRNWIPPVAIRSLRADRSLGIDRGSIRRPAAEEPAPAPAPAPQPKPKQSAPEFSIGDAWLATVAPADPKSPVPLVYVLGRSAADNAPTVELYRRAIDQDGRRRLARITVADVNSLRLDAIDRAAVATLRDARLETTFSGFSGQTLIRRVIAIAARAGRLHGFLAPGAVGPALRWRGDEAWAPELHAAPRAEGGARIWARLRSAGGDAIDAREPGAIELGGLYVIGDSVLLATPEEKPEAQSQPRRRRSRRRRRRGPKPLPDLPWLAGYTADFVERLLVGPRAIPPAEMEELLDEVRNGAWAEPQHADHPDAARRPTHHIDPRLGIRYFVGTPSPVLRLDGSPDRSTADLLPLARYQHPDDPGIAVDRDARSHGIVDDPRDPALTVPYIDHVAEDEIAHRAEGLLRRSRGSGRRQWRIARDHLPKLIEAAGRAGFAVEMSRQPARAGKEWSLGITSGLDWFDLNGGLQTEEGWIPLHELVQAARRHPDAVEILPLADGTTVSIPAKLRAVLRRLAQVWTGRDGHELRFSRADVLFLDGLLASADRQTDNAAFCALRDRLANVEPCKALDPHPDFRGELRPYQKSGLGWLVGLRELGVGGCLADEMGLGKTVQVLAMLDARRAERTAASSSAKSPPALLVVPRSIVRNWVDEATRFAPKLRVADLSGPNRSLDEATWNGCDVAVMTYGTVLRDVETLAKRRFDYVILDEAQAIKTASSRTAKAVKCLVADHRLAMTGTPIENHLGELWSVMGFLNPKLGAHLAKLARDGEREDLVIVREAVRPFLLRRTKSDVAQDLPERIEQTMFCDLTEDQREHYDALLAKLKADLFGRIDKIGFSKARLDVLEGLLRLRQIACHPVLADKRRASAGSGKLEALLPMLEESAEEGRKTLVFSQFTSFLALVRELLEANGITYEYLDGKTQDRAERVRRFASDESCSVFLLSLKAGGVGLNLQAAERVILLDPWWNPAVEAQAIDRAHRIGQSRTVHAIRLVSSGTIEERVLDLQRRKRVLADAILSDDPTHSSEATSEGPLAALTREDLSFLLSTGEQPIPDFVPPLPAKAKAKRVTVEEPDEPEGEVGDASVDVSAVVPAPLPTPERVTTSEPDAAPAASSTVTPRRKPVAATKLKAKPVTAKKAKVKAKVKASAKPVLTDTPIPKERTKAKAVAKPAAKVVKAAAAAKKKVAKAASKAATKGKAKAKPGSKPKPNPTTRAASTRR